MRTESRAPGAEQGPTDADSQSTSVAPATRHTPRSAPVVSSAKSQGSLPESLTVNQTPGWVCDSAAAEFSTSCGRAWSGIATNFVGCTPMESVARYGARASRRVSGASDVPQAEAALIAAEAHAAVTVARLHRLNFALGPLTPARVGDASR